MTKGGSHKMRGGSRKRRGGSHKMRGGNNYSSAASYGGYVNGTTNEQYDRVFAQGGIPSNVIVGAQGQNSQLVNLPTDANLKLIQSGGRRRKRGGLLNVAPIIAQGAVPLTLVALNNIYGKKYSKSKKGGSVGFDVVPLALLGMQQTYGKTRKNR